MDHIKNFFKSLLSGGLIGNIISVIIILEISLRFIIKNNTTDSNRIINMTDNDAIHIRIGVMLSLMFIVGIQRSSFAYIVFLSSNKKDSIIFWALHSLSFLTFFMNVYIKNEIFFFDNNFDIFIKCLFYIILLTNTLFFFIFIIIFIILSILLLIFPNLRQRIINLTIVQGIINEDDIEFKRGLTEVELNQLPKVNYNKKKTKVKDNKIYDELKEQNKSINNLSYVSAENQCAICYDNFKEKEEIIEIPKCQHLFHKECISEWLTFNINCPMCRQNIHQTIHQTDPNNNDNIIIL